MTSPAPYVTSPYVTGVVDQAYIALGIIVAGIVAGIAYAIVQQAGDNIPDPVVPAGP